MCISIMLGSNKPVCVFLSFSVLDRFFYMRARRAAILAMCCVFNSYKALILFPDASAMELEPWLLSWHLELLCLCSQVAACKVCKGCMQDSIG